MALPLLWPDAAHKFPALFVMENNVQIQSQIHDRWNRKAKVKSLISYYFCEYDFLYWKKEIQ